MKSGPDPNRRKRILIYYSLAVLIPGLVLGYLAYRGIQNDQALREKQARQKMESVSRDFFANLDSLFNLQTERCLQSELSNTDPAILLCFKLSANQDKQILQHQLLYLPSSQLMQPSMNESDPDRWIRGWELEYSNANLNQAYTYYEGIRNSDTDKESQLKALVAMARIRNKLSEPRRALEIYKEISQSFASVNLNGQIPARVLALAEMATIYQTQKNQEYLEKAVNQLMDCLVHPQTKYNKAQYLFFRDIAEPFISHPDTDSLWTLLNRRQIQTGQLLQIFAESNMLSTHFTFGPTQRKFIFQDALKVGYVMTELPSGDKYGLVIDLFPWMEENRELIFSDLQREKDLSWKLTGEDFLSRFSGEENPSDDWLSFSFTDNLPPWKLLLAPKNMGWAATILQPGNGVFILIFGFIILIMLMGLVFTIHILNQELRLNKLKTEFISNVSHELKSPLTSIRQMTEMLHHKRIDTEEQRSDYYAFMLDQSEHLSHLIDNILDFSRMEEHRKLYHFEPLDLAPVIEQLSRNFQRQFEESGFDFQLRMDPGQIVVKADKEAIRQVLYNLLDNAVKYSGSSRRIEIKATIEGRRQEAEGKNQEEDLRRKKEGGAVVVGVRDWGIGIEKKEQERIFERFYRSGAIQKLGIKGSGIGLTLVKGIVEAHEGRLEVESHFGEGTTIYVYLPVCKEDIHEEDIAD